MFDLLDKVADRGAALLAGHLFDDPAEGSDSHAMRWFKLGLMSKRSATGQGHDFPFTSIGLLGGKDTDRLGHLRVRLVSGLYVNPDGDQDGTIDQGELLAERATAAMQAVVDMIRGLAADGNYSPYSLEEISWWVGDENGHHPGVDQYYVSADLLFSQEPVINNF